MYFRTYCQVALSMTEYFGICNGEWFFILYLLFYIDVYL